MAEVFNDMDESYQVISEILGKALFATLKVNEGVLVHMHGKVWIVSKEFNEEHGEPQVGIADGSDYEHLPDLQMLWLEDEQVGNA